jgi:hypothetical protein
MEALSDFFGPLHSIQPTRATTRPGFSRKPQVAGEQNESVGHPESKRREERSSSLCDACSLKGWTKAQRAPSPPLEIRVAGSGSVDLLHMIPARAVATLQPHIGDDARFCRVGINTVRSDHDGQVVLALTVSR